MIFTTIADQVLPVCPEMRPKKKISDDGKTAPSQSSAVASSEAVDSKADEQDEEVVDESEPIMDEEKREEQPEVEEEEEDQSIRKGKSKAKPKRKPVAKAKKRKKKVDAEDEEEDDEEEEYQDNEEEETGKRGRKAARAEPPRTKRRKVSENATASETQEENEDEEKDPYDEDLYLDDADRQRVLAMPDLQREEILYERGEERRKIRERQEARRQFRQQQEQEVDDNSVGARARDRRGRQNAAAAAIKSKTVSALSDLKARRSKAAAQTDEDERARERRAVLEEAEAEEEAQEAEASAVADEELPDAEEPREEEGTEDDEDETDKRPKRVKDTPPPATPITHKALLECQLRRISLERLIHEPYFDEYVVGSFVRVVIGQNNHSQQVYRCCEVKAVPEQAKAYRVGSVDTRKALLLAFGRAERLFKIILVSNSTITEDEFRSWLKQMEKDHLKPPSSEEVLQRHKKGEHLRLGFRYDQKIVNEIIQKKKTFSLKTVNIAAEKTRLKKEIDKCRERGDMTEAERLQKQLDDVEEYARKQRAKQYSTSKSNPLGISELNRRNKLANYKVVDDVGREVAVSAQSSGGKAADPFMRRRTAPTLTWVGASAADDERKRQEEAAAKEKEQQKQKEKELEKARAAQQAATGPGGISVSLLQALASNVQLPITPRSLAIRAKAAPDARSSLAALTFADAAPRSDNAWQTLTDIHRSMHLDINLSAQPLPRKLQVYSARPPRNCVRTFSLHEYEERIDQEASDIEA